MKNLLNLKGAKSLSKKEKKEVNGGGRDFNNVYYCLFTIGGSLSASACNANCNGTCYEVISYGSGTGCYVCVGPPIQ